MRTKSKLGRNLRPGDRFEIVDLTVSPARKEIVTVRDVAETLPGFMSGRRQWHVMLEPGVWWMNRGLDYYSDDRVDVIV